ncbi:MAG: hypothetical protein N4A74_05725 [Carboxylicivirga sp.]|nr:hypothetical protein [Carboxylicivirga sp.]
MKNCDECAHLVIAVSQTANEIELTNSFESTEPKTWQYGLAIAASIAAIISIGIFFNSTPTLTKQSNFSKNIDNYSPPVDSNKHNPTEKDKQMPIKELQINLTQKNKQALLAYATNKELDQLCNRFINASLRSEEIKVTSPTLIESQNNKLHLQWINGNKQSLIVELYNNGGKLINEYKTNDSQSHTVQLKDKGIFYWKLLNEDFDLLFCGKIYFY